VLFPIDRPKLFELFQLSETDLINAVRNPLKTLLGEEDSLKYPRILYGLAYEILGLIDMLLTAQILDCEKELNFDEILNFLNKTFLGIKKTIDGDEIDVEPVNLLAYQTQPLNQSDSLRMRSIFFSHYISNCDKLHSEVIALERLLARRGLAVNMHNKASRLLKELTKNNEILFAKLPYYCSKDNNDTDLTLLNQLEKKRLQLLYDLFFFLTAETEKSKHIDQIKQYILDLKDEFLQRKFYDELDKICGFLLGPDRSDKILAKTFIDCVEVAHDYQETEFLVQLLISANRFLDTKDARAEKEHLYQYKKIIAELQRRALINLLRGILRAALLIPSLIDNEETKACFVQAKTDHRLAQSCKQLFFYKAKLENSASENIEAKQAPSPSVDLFRNVVM
jgi:hypothetical protein